MFTVHYTKEDYTWLQHQFRLVKVSVEQVPGLFSVMLVLFSRVKDCDIYLVSLV